MTLTKERRAQCAKAVTLLDKLPDGLWVEFDGGKGLSFQGHSQEQTRAIRAYFPGIRWDKEFNESCNWWEYRSTYRGVPLKIYAVTEAPPACRCIEEETWVEEQVPTQFETRTVKRVKVTWDCGKKASSA